VGNNNSKGRRIMDIDREMELLSQTLIELAREIGREKDPISRSDLMKQGDAIYLRLNILQTTAALDDPTIQTCCDRCSENKSYN
jgi:hypothetical protein